MIPRESLARIVYEDSVMLGLGYVQDRVYASNAVDTPSQSAPFIVINHDLTQKQFETTGAHTISYWVHRPMALGRDYNPIDEALHRIKELLVAVEHFAGSDGWSLTGASWIDTSRDLTDDVYHTFVKYSTFRIASRSLVTP